MGSCLGNPLRKVKVLNLWAIHPDQVQNLLAHPRHFDLYNYLDLARRHLALLSEVEPYQKDALIVISFILGFVVLFKCAFNVDR